MGITTILKKFKIAKISYCTKPIHVPEDDDDDELGARLYLTKGDKIEINEELLFKGLNKEFELSKDEEFDISVKNPETLIKGEIGFSEDETSVRYIVKSDAEYKTIYECMPSNEIGITLIKGLIDKETELHSIVFDKKVFDMQKAESWLAYHCKNWNNLKKGENSNMNFEKDVLPLINKSLDEKFTPLNEKINNMELRLSKMETPTEPPKVDPPKDPLTPDPVKVELEKSLRENKEKTEQILANLTELKKSQDSIDTRVKAFEKIGLQSISATGIPGFIGTQLDGTKKIKHGDLEMVKGNSEDGIGGFTFKKAEVK